MWLPPSHRKKNLKERHETQNVLKFHGTILSCPGFSWCTADFFFFFRMVQYHNYGLKRKVLIPCRCFSCFLAVLTQSQGLFQLLFTSLLVRRTGVHKKNKNLEGDRARAAVPNQPKRYSIPHDIM